MRGNRGNLQRHLETRGMVKLGAIPREVRQHPWNCCRTPVTVSQDSRNSAKLRRRLGKHPMDLITHALPSSQYRNIMIVRFGSSFAEHPEPRPQAPAQARAASTQRVSGASTIRSTVCTSTARCARRGYARGDPSTNLRVRVRLPMRFRSGREQPLIVHTAYACATCARK